MVLDVSATRVVPVAQDVAYDRTIVAPLPDLMGHRYGPIPPITSVTGQEGSWSTAGQSRTIHLADGGSVHETLTAAERPDRFTYVLSDITGPMKLLVGGVEGRWEFAHSSAGTAVTWGWRIHPRSRVAGPLLPVLGFFWKKYAAKALVNVEAAVGRG